MRKEVMKLTDYKILGKSGLRVSPLSLGTMTFGEDWGWGSSPETAMALISRYTELGGNVIDTANVYTKGHSEKIIGAHLKKTGLRRDGLVISSKFFCNMYPGDPNAGGTSRKAIIESLENSLRRLQTDYIDVYWMHAFDPFTPIEESMSALNDAVRSGKVRYIGVSDTPAWKVAQAQMITEFRGWPSFIGLQLEYSLLERTVEGELLPMAEELGLGVMPWSPLKEGVLSGKYTRRNQGEVQSGRNGSRLIPELSEQTYGIIDQLHVLAEAKESSPAAIALAWVMSRAGVTSTIVGARTMEQLNQNLQALSVVLDPEEVTSLDRLTEPVLSFPIPFLRDGARHMAQAGANINNRSSVVPDLLPENLDDVY